MPRKILLSFLGTNNYITCNYHVEGHPDQKVDNARYIQEAIFKLYCHDFTDNDRVLLFLTEKAELMNFLDNGQFNRDTNQYDLANVGLYSRFQELKKEGFQFELVHRRIKEGFSEKEVWSIFETVANEFQEGDQIIFDITHAFRFLPMLGIVLLNYLKVTKNISVLGVHYGAFEKLGSQQEVLNLPIQNRNAPIIDLSTLLEFQSWTSAVNSFVKFGETKELREASQFKIKSRMAETKGTDLATKDLRFVIDQLSEMTAHLQTNRLNQLLGKDFSQFKEKLASVQNTDMVVKPFKQILRLVEKKATPIITSKELIWLESSKWCLEHKLVQQAFTQLQEGLLTYCMNEFKKELETNINFQTILSKYDIRQTVSFIDLSDRDLYKGFLNVLFQLSQSKVKKNIEYYLVEIASIFLNTKFEKLAHVFAHISESRNDINHAGLRNDPMKADALQKRIGQLIQEVEELLK